MQLIYFHNPLDGIIFLAGILLAFVILVIWLLVTFGVGKSKKSNDEKVNPIISSMENKNHFDR